MNKPPGPGDIFGAWRRLAQQLQAAQRQAQQQAQRGARSNLRYAGGSGGGGASGGGGSGRGPSPRAARRGAGALALLLGGGVLVNAAIFNVDGGHRAIKYSRFAGVRDEVYPEGTHFRVSRRPPCLSHSSHCNSQWLGESRGQAASPAAPARQR